MPALEAYHFLLLFFPPPLFFQYREGKYRQIEREGSRESPATTTMGREVDTEEDSSSSMGLILSGSKPAATNSLTPPPPPCASPSSPHIHSDGSYPVTPSSDEGRGDAGRELGGGVLGVSVFGGSVTHLEVSRAAERGGERERGW
jgi:hypothetical protein